MAEKIYEKCTNCKEKMRKRRERVQFLLGLILTQREIAWLLDCSLGTVNSDIKAANPRHISPYAVLSEIIIRLTERRLLDEETAFRLENYVLRRIL